MKIIAVIPAHMASVRFPGKILHEIEGLPMIEHVRRRALMSKKIDDVYVATCDLEIATVIKRFGGKVLMTSSSHQNGTSRVIEAIQDVECSHVILLQGDEPLLLPRHVDLMVDAIEKNHNAVMWNATAPISAEEELDRHSFVKCLISNSNRILICFRRSPLFGSVELQKLYIKKILGIIAYEKKFLLSLDNYSSSKLELLESIEQMKVIENDGQIISVAVEPSLPSINQPDEVDAVLAMLENNVEQVFLLKEVLNAQ